MDCIASPDDAWLVSETHAFMSRIETLLRLIRTQAPYGRPLDVDRNWIRIHDLLVQLHAQVSSDSGREALAPLLLRLGLELAVMEALVGASPASGPSRTLH